VAEEARRAVDTNDAQLLNMVRAGDSRALEVLFERHSGAARRLAKDLVVSPAEADEVVADTFTRVLALLRGGGGPTDAFRPYLLTVLQRVCDDRLQKRRGPRPVDRELTSDPDRPFLDHAGVEAETLIIRAFRALPERWGALLWHTEIERESPQDVAPLFGLSFDGLGALERRAREGLRQTYLDLYKVRLTRPECKPAVEHLSAFLRYALSGPEAGQVASHLSDCDECRAAHSELADVGATLRSVLAPIILGGSASAYLAGDGDDVPLGAAVQGAGRQAGAIDHPAATDSAVTSAAAAGQALRPARLAAARRIAQLSRRHRWLLAAGGVAVAATITAALAITTTGPGRPSPHLLRPHIDAGSPGDVALGGQRSTSAQSGKDSSRSTAKTSSPGQNSTARATPDTSTPSSRSHPARSPSPSATPSPTAGSSASGVTLAARIDVFGFGSFGIDVLFRVTDSGSAATGGLTADITLPPGSSMSGVGHGHQSKRWTCRPTSSGASCQHDPISAGQTANGAILVKLSGTAACGQAVEVTATASGASVSAQSPETIQCASGADVPTASHLADSTPSLTSAIGSARLSAA
jgi:RNA polymerase sigma factor (sigma-70 family)